KDPEYRNKASQILKEKYRDPEYKNKLSQILKEKWQSSEYRDKLSLRSKKLWEDPEYKAKQAKAHAAWLALYSGKDSIIERVTQQILDQLNIKFERQKILGPYSFDLFVPSHNLLIECQGEYW